MVKTLVNKRRGLLVGLGVALSMLFVAPFSTSAQDSKDDGTLQRAADVLTEMLNSQNVSQSWLMKSDCIVVLPDVKKFGIGIGGSGGRGAMSCRTGTNYTGPWSAPALYSVGGLSAGLQIGGSSTDFILLVTTQHGVDALLKGKTKLGSEASVAAGPTGATTTSGVGDADVLSYGKTKGLFAGVSLGGATLEPDDNGNKKLYGKPVTAQQIVLGNAVHPTPAAGPLIMVLNSKAGQRSPG